MYLTDLVIVLDGKFDYADVVQHNLRNAGKKCRLMIYNNGCISPDQDLLEMSSVYIENTTPVEKSYAECVNELIPRSSGDFIVFFQHFAYYSDNWLEKIVDAQVKNFNSGSVSISSDQLQWTFVLNEDDLVGVFEPNERNSGMFLISKEILRSVGLFDMTLKDVSSFWHYQERVKLLGYNNYSFPDAWCIEMGAYQSNYFISQKQYKNHLKKTIKENTIFIPIHRISDLDQKISSEIKAKIDCSIQFSERLGCLVCILPQINNLQINIISKVCKNFKKSFEIVPSSYFEDLLLKNSLLLMIK